MTEFLTKDSALPPYLMFPRFLLDSPLNETAKLLYVVLLDRARLSQQNEGWTDDQGRVFLYFPIKDLAETLHKGETAIKKALNALEKANLIIRVRRGSIANQIYVKCLTDEKAPIRQAEKRPSNRRKSDCQTGGKAPTSNNYLKRTKEKQQKRISGLPNYDCGEDESL
jgi:DNA-binding MarR family transcriptional regulator